MATGKATVVNPGNSLKNTVHKATGDAVRAAQNAGASKADVIRAREAAKNNVYAGAVQAINSGGSYKGMSAQQLQNEIYGGLNQTDFSSGTPVAFVQSRDHLNSMQKAGFYDADWNPTSKAAAQAPNKVSTKMQVLSFEPAAVQPKDLGIRQRFRYESMRLKESKNPIIKAAASALPDYYDPVVVKKTEENALDFNNLSSAAFDPATSFALKFTESKKNPLRVDKNAVVDSALENLFTNYTGEDVSGKGEIIQAAGNRGTDWIDDKAGRLHDWSVRNLDGRFGAVGSFIRGMAPDALVGVGTLVSEGTKTITAGVREAKKSGAGLTGSTRTQAMATSFAEMIGAGVGGIIGGTARGAKEDPIAFAGGLIGTGGVAGVGKLGSGIGRFRIKAARQAGGKIDVSLKDLGVDPKLIEMGGDVYRLQEKAAWPDAYPVKSGITMQEGISMLENAKNLYPGKKSGNTMLIHSSAKNRGDIYSPHIGRSPEPGMFGAESPSIRFMQIPYFKNTNLVGFSNPFKSSNKKIGELSPRIMFIEGKGIKSPPVTSKVKTVDFLLNDADAGYFWTTHKMRRRIKDGQLVEVEAVITPKTTISAFDNKPYSDATLYRVESKYRTTVKQPIDIFGKKIDVDLKVPVEKYIAVTADDMALVPVSAPAKKSRFFSPDSKGKDGSLTYPVGTNMNLQATPAKAVKNVTEISRKNGSIKEMFAARRTVSSEVSERHKTGMASKIYDSKKMFEPTESIKPIASANSSTAARISRLTAGNEAIKPKASSTQNLNNLLHNKKPQKTKTKKSDSGNSSRKSSKTATYPIVDLTFSAPSIARGSAAKSEGYVTGYSSDEYSAAPSRGFGKSVKKSAYSSTGSSKSGFKAETAKTTAARPIKKVEKKVKKEETTASVKRTKKTAKRKTEREFRINPLKGLKI